MCIIKIVLQRVSSASVAVDGEILGEIGRGYLVLLGVGSEDTEEDCRRLADKIINMRIFEDADGKINLSLGDVGGGLLIVSQFTLYADCRKRRPSFTSAAPPQMAERLYNYFTDYCRSKVETVRNGSFGAHMTVSLVNDGPFTVML